MKKILLIPAVLALSTGFAFADGWGGNHGGGGVDLTQISNLQQSIGNTSTGGYASNRAFVLQAQVPINQRRGVDLYQRSDISQSIGNTSTGGEARNRATVIQVQAPLTFAAP